MFGGISIGGVGGGVGCGVGVAPPATANGPPLAPNIVTPA